MNNKLSTVVKEIEKCEARVQRTFETLRKKATAAAKVGANINDAAWNALSQERKDEIFPKYFEKHMAEYYYLEARQQLKKAKQVFEKRSIEIEKLEQSKQIQDAEKQRSQEIEEWAKDGIKVEQMNNRYVSGTTPKGKHFNISSNNGMENRSRHCYCLTIDGQTIFTSGEFYRAYVMVKRS